MVQADRKVTITRITTLQPRSAEDNLWTHNTSNLEAEVNLDAPLSAENRGYNLHRLTKIG